MLIGRKDGGRGGIGDVTEQLGSHTSAPFPPSESVPFCGSASNVLRPDNCGLPELRLVGGVALRYFVVLVGSTCRPSMRDIPDLSRPHSHQYIELVRAAVAALEEIERHREGKALMTLSQLAANNLFSHGVYAPSDAAQTAKGWDCFLAPPTSCIALSPRQGAIKGR